ncbi:MAG: hypothetical protein OEZ13_01350 [Spirochaetia bacterium]|nr:hypothetical protein [Spirochaetia bacterium]
MRSINIKTFLNKTVIRKFIFISLGLFFLYNSIISFIADRFYSIEKSTLWISLSSQIPQKTDYDNLLLAAKLLPEEYDYHFLLGKYNLFNINTQSAAEKMNMFIKAENHFMNALEINPTRTEILSYLGWMYFSLADFNKGNDLFNKAIRISPNNYFVRAYYAISVFQFLDKLPENLKSIYLYRALEEIKISIELNPSLETSQSIIEILCKISLMNKDIISASKYIKSIKRIDKNNINIFLSTIENYINNTEIRKAEKLYIHILEKSIENNELTLIILRHMQNSINQSNDKNILSFAAQVFYEYNQYQKAIFFAQKAIHLQDNIVKNYYLTALSYEKLRQNKKAYDFFVKVLKLDSRHKQAEKKIIEYQKSLIIIK